ncbi:DAO-domain-containing protein [Heliocybe sulcata]|uniref:DAO-domain-containing protein n=1 Tax=Heliocybe sulcata TaxID=5364 RepID=A0A5C3NA01_9AGAM|nr:DAO-domain-containing protein [Heliocybe sulcata]
MRPPDLDATAADRFEVGLENTRRYGDGTQIEYLADDTAIKAKCGLITGDLKGWTGVFNGNAGWVEAKRSMEVLGAYCSEHGVKFISGPSGVMKELIRDPQTNAVLGVQAEDGSQHLAKCIVVATGAWSESLLDFEGQLFSGAYGFAHIQLTKEETEKYSSMPVLHAPNIGYCFPPTPDGIFKIANLTYTRTNYTSVNGRLVSFPRDRSLHPTDTLSEEGIAECRQIAQACLPELGDRPIIHSTMCWDTESIDFNWIVSPHPSSPSSLYIATAGSGHSFKNLPVIGKYVCDCLEGRLPEDLRKTWRWRPDKVEGAPQLSRVDIKDQHGWRHDGRSEKEAV